jgi:exopolyphosphatase/guanosine-5'-triphosphate,3'-diphosphate pyrophosphatase
MDEALTASPGRGRGRAGDGRGAPGQPPIFAALDLGTNNCRLLIAARTSNGFRIIDSFSRIVRLGEGLAMSGRLGEAAMERALGALRVCADKIARRGASRVSAVATQACRTAANGPGFLSEVEEKTGLRLSIISPREEAQLSVAGCLNLLDREARAALVVDVGGGSTEMSWIDLTAAGLDAGSQRVAHWRLPIKAWLSIPIGVVTLAERFPERAGEGMAWFRSMVEAMKSHIEAFTRAEDFRAIFAAGSAHLVGTSGAITSLAGVHLGLARYDRGRVDGLWMTRAECDAVTRRLAALTVGERAAQPCIGPDRADLVMAGAAILAAVQELWPCERVRVADRGLREGLLLSLMAGRGGGRRRRRGGVDQGAAA